MVNLPPLSLYIHIPWCVQKCPYCDFNSHALKGEVPHDDYVQHLLSDLDTEVAHAQGRAVKTIFIGGGTPSLLSGPAMQTLLDGVRARLNLAEDAEITMEANPGTVEADRFVDYQRAGVNRISIGVQSFSSAKLERLGRIHGPEEAKRAAHLASGLGLRSFNLDLMHGLPDQTLEEALGDRFLLVTQNIDNLHERAGNQNIIHMHGELLKVHCSQSGQILEWTGDVTPEDKCHCCQFPAPLRPHVVWFGEMPLGMDEIYMALAMADVFIAIGTSGHVYPAAGFVHEAKLHGAHTVELNLEPSQVGSEFEEKYYGPASQVVPEFVEKLLKGL